MIVLAILVLVIGAVLALTSIAGFAEWRHGLSDRERPPASRTPWWQPAVTLLAGLVLIAAGWVMLS